MAEIYMTRCSICERKFKSRKALENHFKSRHHGHELPQNIEFSLGDKQAPQVHRRLLKERKMHERYMGWLAELVECINSAHNPSVPGRYLQSTIKFSIKIILNSPHV